MPPTPPTPPAAACINPGAGIDYGLFLDCVHCGLCTSACPTYVETGNENDSPRGRIYLMRGVTDGRLELTHEVRRHLELCLDCRACETACPSGVQYGKLIEPFRVAMERADGGSQVARLVPPLDSVSAVSLSRIACGRRWRRRAWRRCCGSTGPCAAAGLLRLAAAATAAAGRLLPPLGKASAGAARGVAGDRHAAGPRGAVHRLRGRRDVSRHALGHGPRAAAKRLRSARAASTRPVAGRFTFMPAAASRRGNWPTRTWPRSTRTTSTR